MKHHLLLTGFLILSTSWLNAQPFAELYRQSIEEYKRGNFKGFLSATKQADSLRPNHRVLLYNLAAGYLLNGEKEKAVAILKKRISFYAGTEFMEDEDFKVLVGTKEFSEVQALIDEMVSRKQTSRRAFTIDEPLLHPEGIAYDAKRSRFLISDIHKGKIIAFPESGERPETIIDLGEKGYWSAMGVGIDPNKPDILWVTSSSIPEFSGFKKMEEGKSVLLKVDILRGEIIDVFIPGDEGNHILGDLTLASDGTLFITDSIQPVIYTFKPEEGRLRRLFRNENWWSLQGLALSVDEKALFVSDYILGIMKIDLDTGAYQPLLSGTDNVLTRSTDGVYRIGNRLIFLQNGTLPVRIGSVELDSESRAVDSTLFFTDRAVEAISEPTLGVITGNELYYIANSPWAYYDQEFNPRKEEWPAVHVYKLTID